MKEYVKVVLYAYPILKEMGEEYGVHISNRAVLSYKSAKPTEELVEYLAKEIICKQRLEWLTKFLEDVMDKLDETEKTLLHIRYFSASKSRRSCTVQKENAEILSGIAAWSDSTYFRRQNRLAEKFEAMLHNAGLSEEIFEKDFAFIDIFQCVRRFLARGGDNRLRQKERV